eukprot:3785675-Amphidinium_carterae.1
MARGHGPLIVPLGNIALHLQVPVACKCPLFDPLVFGSDLLFIELPSALTIVRRLLVPAAYAQAQDDLK